MPATPNVIDLFSGAGGLSFAFHSAGFRILAAVEHDAKAAESYRRSFINTHSPSTILINEDIRSAGVAEKLARISKRQPVDVIIGGPPCQDFSPARLKLRRNGKRANLVKTYFKTISALTPEVFIFENVPNIMRAANGKYWKTIRDMASSLGYEMSFAELDATNFGVPQRRRRLFVVGHRGTLSRFKIPTRNRARLRTVMDTIGHLPKLSAGEACGKDPMHRARNHRPHMVRYFAQIPSGGSWRDAERRLPCQLGHSGHYDTYGRICGDSVAPTLTGGCTNPSKGRFIHPTQDRGLTVREAALLQTFPRNWYFHGGVESASLQVGNAVPIKVGKTVATQIKKHLQVT